MAPILSFTAEEAWRLLAPGDETIFVHTGYAFPQVPDGAALLEKWARIRAFRSEVQKLLEALRETGRIGSSLQAEVDVAANGEESDLLRSLDDDLRFVLIASRATVKPAPSAGEERIVVVPSAHPKCARCWHYRADVGADRAHPGICGRCVANLFGAGEPREHA